MAKKRPERTLGEVLTEARDALDDPPSFEQIARRLEHHGVTVSFQTVINYHDDAVKKPDVEIVLALASNVEPGQTALWDGLTTSDYTAGAVCKVSTVSRTASL